MKYVKGLGYVAGAASVGISFGRAANFYYNGGRGIGVGGKAILDGAMVVVGFLGPVGFVVSSVYFIADAASNGFGGWGDPEKQMELQNKK